jgi:hypothetical protein
MTTYILLDPNEIVQQQQAMAAAVAVNNTTTNNNLLNPNLNIQNKSSSSNDVSLNERTFEVIFFLFTNRLK